MVTGSTGISTNQSGLNLPGSAVKVKYLFKWMWLFPSSCISSSKWDIPSSIELCPDSGIVGMSPPIRGCRITNPVAQSSPTCCLSAGHQLGTLTLASGSPRSPRDCRAPLASSSNQRETQQFYSGFTPVSWEKFAWYSYSPKLIFSNYTSGRSLGNVLCENIKNV